MRLNVSILVICYEQEDFIEETLLSAVNQGPGVEIVVADDCSKDGTCDVVEAVARGSETPIRLIRGGQNVGITGNCNRGLAACRGELLAMLGGDDLMYPGKVAKQREWMAMSHDRVLCGHDAEHFDSETGETLYLSSDRTTFLPQETGAAALCRGEAYYAGSSAMLRRAAMPSQGFDERLHMVSDRKMYIDTVGPRGVHGVIPGVWSRYRLHRRNVSHTRRQRMFEELRAHNEEHEDPLDLRVGLHTGPVVAGVIGKNKFIYDLWGDTVNVAARMESHGKPGCIQVTETTEALLRDRFHCEPRGEVEVKGRGRMPTYLLTGLA